MSKDIDVYSEISKVKNSIRSNASNGVNTINEHRQKAKNYIINNKYKINFYLSISIVVILLFFSQLFIPQFQTITNILLSISIMYSIYSYFINKMSVDDDDVKKSLEKISNLGDVTSEDYIRLELMNQQNKEELQKQKYERIKIVLTSKSINSQKYKLKLKEHERKSYKDMKVKYKKQSMDDLRTESLLTIGPFKLVKTDLIKRTTRDYVNKDKQKRIVKSILMNTGLITAITRLFQTPELFTINFFTNFIISICVFLLTSGFTFLTVQLGMLENYYNNLEDKYATLKRLKSIPVREQQTKKENTTIV